MNLERCPKGKLFFSESNIYSAVCVVYDVECVCVHACVYICVLAFQVCASVSGLTADQW